jgi:hypothetical protein
MEKKESKRLKEAMLKVYAADKPTIIKGLKSLRDVGTAGVIHPLLDVHKDAEDEDVRKEIEDILANLKLEAAIHPLVEALEEERFSEQRGLILSSLWNSGFYPSEHLELITKAAIDGDYLCAVEAITVIENMEGPFQFDSVEEASLLVDEFLSEGIEDPKVLLIESLRDLLLDFRADMD